MKQALAVTAVVTMGMLLAGQGYAQEIPPNGPFGGAQGRGDPVAGRREMRPRMAAERGGFGRGGANPQNEMLFRLIQDPQMAREIGLSDEKATALKDAFRKVREKQIDLQAELDKLNLRQTGEIAGLLADRAKKANEAIELVEEMGRVNTELSKLTVERILAIRENLTDDQIKKAHEKANEVAEARRTRIREAVRNRAREDDGAARPEGRRPREGRGRPDRARD
jgi:hypothetical protein